MKLIPLSQGLFAQVDDEDFDFLNQWKWHANKHTKHKSNLTYAIRNVPATKDKKRTAVKMHRVIMKVTDPIIQVDHIDRNALNCQKSNMRTCSNSDNQKNKSASGASRYLGVSLHITKNKLKAGGFNLCIRWRAIIKSNGVTSRIGLFKTQEEAARAYDKEAIKVHGEFANLNFKE